MPTTDAALSGSKREGVAKAQLARLDVVTAWSHPSALPSVSDALVVVGNSWGVFSSQLPLSLGNGKLNVF